MLKSRLLLLVVRTLMLYRDAFEYIGAAVRVAIESSVADVAAPVAAAL